MEKKIISRKRVESIVEFCLEFSNIDGCGGYSFDCNEGGFVNTSSYAEEGLANLINCLTGSNETVYDGIVRYEHNIVIDSVLQCYCGRTVSLGCFTNTCRCGRDYNMNGSLLAPRSCWGEETGETALDILEVDYCG